MGGVVRLEWGERGLDSILPLCTTIVIVDVLRFTTAVEVAVSRGATVEVLPDSSRSKGPGLSPVAMRGVKAGQRVRLYSPNGGILSATAAASGRKVYAACLRNARAVASALEDDSSIGLVPAGERWPDGSLRVAIEDLLGAGAVAEAIGQQLAPEAEAAAAAFAATGNWLDEWLLSCPSGQELVARGLDQDVRVAAELNVSQSVPQLIAGAYRWPPTLSPTGGTES